MQQRGFLKIDDIQGESTVVDHEEEIDITGFQWGLERSTSTARRRGRARSRVEVDSLAVSKFADAASVYLALACMQGKSFPEVVLTMRKDSGEAHLDYLTITMTNVVIEGYDIVKDPDEPDQMPVEEVAFNFEEVKFTYIEQNPDGSAGDEHEIEYDIAAGV